MLTCKSDILCDIQKVGWSFRHLNTKKKMSISFNYVTSGSRWKATFIRRFLVREIVIQNEFSYLHVLCVLESTQLDPVYKRRFSN